MKWYTAVGVKLESRDGVFRVRAGRDTKNLLGVECYVWNTLLWSFTQEAEIYERMVWLLRLAFPGQPEKADIDREEFLLCFRRLLTRGLVVYRENETMEGAAETFLKAANVACVGRTWGERFLSFCESAADGGTFRDSVRVFRKNPLEKAHRQLLKDIRSGGETGFSLERADEKLLWDIMELHQNRLLFIQSVKEGSLA